VPCRPTLRIRTSFQPVATTLRRLASRRRTGATKTAASMNERTNERSTEINYRDDACAITSDVSVTVIYNIDTAVLLTTVLHIVELTDTFFFFFPLSSRPVRCQLYDDEVTTMFVLFHLLPVHCPGLKLSRLDFRSWDISIKNQLKVAYWLVLVCVWFWSCSWGIIILILIGL